MLIHSVWHFMSPNPRHVAAPICQWMFVRMAPTVAPAPAFAESASDRRSTVGPRLLLLLLLTNESFIQLILEQYLAAPDNPHAVA